jgi:hypothetical protein
MTFVPAVMLAVLYCIVCGRCGLGMRGAEHDLWFPVCDVRSCLEFGWVIYKLTIFGSQLMNMITDHTLYKAGQHSCRPHEL